MFENLKPLKFAAEFSSVSSWSSCLVVAAAAAAAVFVVVVGVTNFDAAKNEQKREQFFCRKMSVLLYCMHNLIF